MAVRLYDAPCFGRAPRRAGMAQPHTRRTGTAVERRNAMSPEIMLSQWRRSAQAAVRTLSSTDGRWAMVSTSVTALIAGSIAWLAQGTALPNPSHGYAASEVKTLMPYGLFQRLDAQTKSSHQVQYAS